MTTQPAVHEHENHLAVIDNRPAEIQKFEFQQRAAKLFALSGLFADIKGQSQEQAIAQAFVKISLGDSMGFNPAESMTGIDIIQGRVAVGASIRAARMQRAGYSWDILQLDEAGCRIRLKYKDQVLMGELIDGKTGEVEEVPAIVSYTAEDAQRAGLLGKDNYKKNPRDMFFARAITRAQRWYAPGVLGADILSAEEAMDLDPPSEVKNAKGVKLATQNRAQELADKYKPKELTQVGSASEPLQSGAASADAGASDPMPAEPSVTTSMTALPLNPEVEPLPRLSRKPQDSGQQDIHLNFGGSSGRKHRDQG